MVIIVLIIGLNSYFDQFLQTVWLVFSVKVSNDVLLQTTPKQHYQGLLAELNLYYF